MLKKENRLTKKEFDFTYKNAYKKFSKNFLFLCFDLQKNPSDFSAKSVKISTTISKKILKKAVKRNKARRLMYRILKKNEKLFLEKDFWAVLIATKNILEIDKKEIEKEILNFIK